MRGGRSGLAWYYEGGFGGLLMKVFAAVLLVVGVLVGVVGCGGGEVVGPTADVGATVEAGVRGTREAEAGIEGTVAARVAGTAAALPTATPAPTPTATPAPTVAPTATPVPTATPAPTPAPTAGFTPGEIEVVAGNLYDCVQGNPDFKQIFVEAAVLGVATEGVAQESAEYLVELMLSSREFFRLSFEEVAADDPLFVADMELLIEWCQGVSSASAMDGTPLAEYAAQYAGGPGAIYVGDLGQLAGPAVTAEFMDRYGVDLGDDDGNVPLDAIWQHAWIYESDYYQSLLVKARLTNPTELVSRGESITLQHACINRALLPCEHLASYFVPNVAERTNGQVTIEITSFPELGVAGPDIGTLLAYGDLDMTNVYSGYIAGEYPEAEVQSLWGLWTDHQTHYVAQTSIFPELEQMITEEMNAQVLMYNWFAGNDQFIFSKTRLNTPDDFDGMKTRSHSAALSDWINGMGASAQFVAFAEVYTALERGILDAGITGATPGYGQRWYEVVGYINGTLHSFLSSPNAINRDVWDGIPRDIQQILIEEGAKQELEALRLAAIQNLTGLQHNIDAGMEFVEFSPEIRRHSFQVVRESVIPNWLRRLGYPGRNRDVVGVFNDKIGPVVGLRIEPDGAVVVVPITAGPHAGRVMEWVLSE